FPPQVLSTRLFQARLLPAAVSVWRFAFPALSTVWHHQLSYHQTDCATDNRFAQQPRARDTHQPRFCLHQEGDLLGQASEQSVPACGAFSVYSSCDPFSPKTRGLRTHITNGPKKWGQATLCSDHEANLGSIVRISSLKVKGALRENKSSTLTSRLAPPKTIAFSWRSRVRLS